MSAASATLITSGAPYRLREFHAFEAAGSRFLYAVPSGAIFALNAIGQEILECVQERSPNAEELMEWLLSRGHERWDVETALMELEESEVIMRGDSVFAYRLIANPAGSCKDFSSRGAAYHSLMPSFQEPGMRFFQRSGSRHATIAATAARTTKAAIKRRNIEVGQRLVEAVEWTTLIASKRCGSFLRSRSSFPDRYLIARQC